MTAAEDHRKRSICMSVEHWLAFAAASAILVAIPGPTVLLVISYALGHGRRSAAATVAGVALGDLTAMTASMLGLGALLAASAAIFTVCCAGSAAPTWSGSASGCGGRRCRRRRWLRRRAWGRGACWRMPMPSRP